MNRTKRIKRWAAGLAVAGLVLVAGCTSDDDAEAVPVEHVETAETANAAEDPALTVCAGFFDGDNPLAERVPELLTSIGPELADPVPYQMTDTRLDGLIQDAPPEMVGPLETIRAPFAEVSDVVAAGGGSLSMDTSGVEGAVHELMGLCVDAGYAVG